MNKLIFVLITSLLVSCAPAWAATPIGTTHVADVPCKNGRLAVGACPPGEEIVAAVFGPQSSTFAADHDFDFAETFDGLATWRPQVGRAGNVHYGQVSLPNLANGTDSAWDYFSSWDSNLATTDWIGNNGTNPDGSNTVWRGTKSAAIDLGGNKGPSRLGFYMGPGYQDFYLFFMVNIPKNEFPTSLPSTYTEGQPYTWFSSWKFNTFNVNCPQGACPDRETYSDEYLMLTHFKTRSYGDDQGLTMRFEDINYASTGGGWGFDASGKTHSVDARLGDWFGIEYHVWMTATTVVFDVWYYNQSGVAVKVVHQSTWPLPIAARGHTFNDFFFGGNNSGTYSWGPAMQSVYYIDDVIVDDHPIGAKYFQAIAP